MNTTCIHCGKEIPYKIKRNGKLYYLSSRKFCIECSPLNKRNTRSYIIKLNDDESFCARCQKVKKINNFYKRKDNGKPFSYCISCQEKVKKLKFEEKLEIIIQIFGNACYDCGIIYPTSVYNFYSEGNIFSINKAKNMSLGRLKKELEGYIMLCKNCCALRKWEKL